MAADRVDVPIEQPSPHPESPSAAEVPRRTLLAAGAGLAAAGLLALVGPHPVGPASGRSGDPALLARAEPHLRGLNRVALAHLDGDTIRYAGVGADERTLFEIGSVSKTFCGAVLMDMVATQEVTLDTTVGDITDAHGSELADVTVRELASHTSGLPDFTPIETASQNTRFGLLHADGARQDATETVSDILAQPVGARGTFSYSTAGIALLAHLLARRAGTTYQELLTRRILAPLGLTDTSLPITRAGLPQRWRKGLLGGRPAEPWTLKGLAPGGGMWSTCADLGTWMRLTRDGHQPGAAGLEPVAPAPIPPYMPEAQVAITWIRAMTPGGADMVFHNGLSGSYHSFVGYCPQTGCGLAYLVNSRPTGAQLLMLQGGLVGTLLDEKA
jgi:CubicO group peptidase (beta-lactamase class C family)